MPPGRFTAERPGTGELFAYDQARHLAAYTYALELARGRHVLDAGCGEGFGTQRLAEVARSVVGVDYSADAVAAAEGAWRRSNLSFRQLDLTKPGDEHERFDLVCSFQVLEHMVDPLSFLERLRNRLAPGGTLLLTTPNRLTAFSENPYHVREYAPVELHALLVRVFATVTLLGMHGNAKVQAFDRARGRAVARLLRLDPLGLRRHLPGWLVRRLFAALAVVVRRRVRGQDATTTSIDPSDFEVRPEHVDQAVDLVALCRVSDYSK